LYRDIGKQFYIASQMLYLRKNTHLTKVYHFLLETLFAMINIYLNEKKNCNGQASQCSERVHRARRGLPLRQD